MTVIVCLCLCSATTQGDMDERRKVLWREKETQKSFTALKAETKKEAIVELLDRLFDIDNLFFKGLKCEKSINISNPN